MRHTVADELRAGLGSCGLVPAAEDIGCFLGLTLWPMTERDKHLIAQELTRWEHWAPLRHRAADPEFALFDIAVVIQEATTASAEAVRERWARVLRGLSHQFLAKEIASQHFGVFALGGHNSKWQYDRVLSVAADWTEAARGEAVLGNLSHGPPGQERIFLARDQGEPALAVTDAQLSEHVLWHSFGSAGISSRGEFVSLCQRLRLERPGTGEPARHVSPVKSGSACLIWNGEGFEVGLRYSDQRPSAMWCLDREEAGCSMSLQMWCKAQDKRDLPAVMRSVGKSDSEDGIASFTVAVEGSVRSVGIPALQEFATTNYVVFDFQRR